VKSSCSCVACACGIRPTRWPCSGLDSHFELCVSQNDSAVLFPHLGSTTSPLQHADCVLKSLAIYRRRTLRSDHPRRDTRAADCLETGSHGSRNQIIHGCHFPRIIQCDSHRSPYGQRDCRMAGPQATSKPSHQQHRPVVHPGNELPRHCGATARPLRAGTDAGRLRISLTERMRCRPRRTLQSFRVLHAATFGRTLAFTASSTALQSSSPAWNVT
jgi:hypothetical protein